MEPDSLSFLTLITKYQRHSVFGVAATLMKKRKQTNKQLNKWSIENLETQKKSYFHDALQTYGQDWIRFDQNEKNIHL